MCLRRRRGVIDEFGAFERKVPFIFVSFVSGSMACFDCKKRR